MASYACGLVWVPARHTRQADRASICMSCLRASVSREEPDFELHLHVAANRMPVGRAELVLNMCAIFKTYASRATPGRRCRAASVCR
jgi:hypothetical protein